MSIIKHRILLVIAVLLLVISILLSKYVNNKRKEQIEFEHEFFECEYGQIALVLNKNLSESSNTMMTLNVINDSEELIEYLYGTTFKLPKYIPTGYELIDATIYFYINENDVKNANLIFSEEKYGKLYQKYEFDKLNKNNISCVFVHYENNEGHYLHYDAYFEESAGLENIYSPAEAEIETLTISEFDSVFFGTYRFADRRSSYVNRKIYLINNISPIISVDAVMLNKELREKAIKKGKYNNYQTTYSLMMYIVSSSSLDESEIIKIAENIK